MFDFVDEARQMRRRWQDLAAAGAPPSYEHRLSDARDLTLRNQARRAGLEPPPAFSGNPRRYSQKLQRWRGASPRPQRARSSRR
jgi:hypothetical protein